MDFCRKNVSKQDYFPNFHVKRLQIPSHLVFPKLIIEPDKERGFIDGNTFGLKKSCTSVSHFPLKQLGL